MVLVISVQRQPARQGRKEDSSREPRLSVPDFASQLWRKI